MHAKYERSLAVFVICALFGFVWTQNQLGATCNLPQGGKGRCVPVLNCTTAIQSLRYFEKPPQCGTMGKTILICCKPGIRNLALEDYNCGFKPKDPKMDVPDELKLGVCMYTSNCTNKADVDKYKLQASHCGHIAKNDLDCCHTKTIMIHDDQCMLANNQVGRCAFLENCPTAKVDLAKTPPVLPPVCGFIGLKPVVCCPELERSLKLGDSCTTKEGDKGRCVFLETCDKAIEDLRANKTPSNCGFDLRRPMVCCPEKGIPNLVGTKSRQKCLQYHIRESLRVRENIVGGEQTKVEEFPHMASIGFQAGDQVRWSCGGTLISDRYVLTAAHCLHSQEFGTPTTIRIGDYNLESTDDDAKPQEFKIAKTHRHPDYKSSSKYDDIALLELSHMVNMFVDSEYIRPACLHTEKDIPKKATPVATGWGLTEFAGNTSDTLIKVALVIYTHEQCNKSYSSSASRRGLNRGILDDRMVCAGGKQDEIKDSCQGDSGGPLQIVHPELYNSYSLIGITSFGKGCGVANSPGVYTRVSHYVEWIEGIIWPQP